MSELKEFADLIKRGAEEKKRQLAHEQKQKIETNAPLLAELFKTVSDAKKVKPVEVAEQPLAETKPAIDVYESAAVEKKFLKLFNRLQNDFQTLKQSVATDRSSMQSAVSSMISSGGSVKILDNDDVEFTKLSDVTENCILVFDAVKKKFVVKDLTIFIQGIQAGVEVQYNKSIDTVDQYTYVGEASPGSLPENPVWRIKRIDDPGTQDINILWANGSADFIHTWSDRLTYNYS